MKEEERRRVTFCWGARADGGKASTDGAVDFRAKKTATMVRILEFYFIVSKQG